MRSKPVTDEELRKTFEQLMSNQPDGGMPTETGLDEQVLTAIEYVWTATSTSRPHMVDAAHAELEAQLDGSHAREQLTAVTGHTGS